MIAIRRELRGLVSISIFQGKDKKNPSSTFFKDFYTDFGTNFHPIFTIRFSGFESLLPFLLQNFSFHWVRKFHFYGKWQLCCSQKRMPQIPVVFLFACRKTVAKKGILDVDTCNYSLIVVWWIFLVHLLDHNAKNDGNLWRCSFHSWAGTKTMDH